MDRDKILMDFWWITKQWQPNREQWLSEWIFLAVFENVERKELEIDGNWKELVESSLWNYDTRHSSNFDRPINQFTRYERAGRKTRALTTRQAN